MRIHADRRSLDIDLSTAPEQRLEAQGAALRPLRVDIARTFVAVEDGGRHGLHGLAQVESLARKYGYGREEAFRYRMVGRAMAIIPELEERLLEGRIPFECAAILGDMTRLPELAWELGPAQPGDTEHEALRTKWLEDAERLVAKSLRLRAEKRKAEARMRNRVVLLRLFVLPETIEKLDRVRKLCSRKAMRALSQAEALMFALDDFLRRHDPMKPHLEAADGDEAEDGSAEVESGEAPATAPERDESTEGRRNGEDTQQDASKGNGSAQKAGPDEGEGIVPVLERTYPPIARYAEYDPRKRAVPAKVKRFVRRRADDCCEYPGCTNDIFLHFAHIKPHAAGGARNARNILLLCSQHHFQFDVGLILFRGWGRDGPIFKTRWGHVVGEYG